MKKGYIFSLVLLVACAGCGGKKKKSKYSKKTEVSTNIDIPVAENGITSFFDTDLDGFVLADDADKKESEKEVIETNPTDNTQNMQYAWVDEQSDSRGFKKVFFDFDQYTVRADQEANLNHNIELAKKAIEENKFFGKEAPVLVIDGHACHSAGSRAYNLALSEKRAKVLADKFEQAGIPQEYIKIVGRGSEVPAMVEGRPCDGNREEQWPNRRDELRIVYS